MSILGLTALELGRKIKARELTAMDAVKAVLEQIKQKEPSIHAYVTIDEEGALRHATEVQEKIEKGSLTSPLAGVPTAIKDNLCTKGMRTTCSSNILYNFVPPLHFSAPAQAFALAVISFLPITCHHCQFFLQHQILL